MSQDRKKRQLLTHTDMHTQVTPMMLLASCLKGVLREHALAPTPLLYQRHLALSQPIRMAINHTSHKHCHPCCCSGSIALSSCPALSLALAPLTHQAYRAFRKCFFPHLKLPTFFTLLPLMAPDLPQPDENVSPASSCSS